MRLIIGRSSSLLHHVALGLLLTLLVSGCMRAPAALQPTTNVSPIDISARPTAIPAPPTTAPGPPVTVPATSTAVPAPPTPDTVPTPETASSQVAPIVDGDTGFLLGGAQKASWLDAATTAPLLTGHERYRLFEGTTNLGSTVGSRPVADTGGPCAGIPIVALNPKPPRAPAVAVGGDWNALPRTVRELSPQAEVYRQAIADLLRANGIAQPEVVLTQVQRVDLDDDGADEVLITATRLAAGANLPPVAAGDYSLIVLRKLVGGKVVTVPLMADYYLQPQDLAYPSAYTVAAVLDLNGDGRQEIVVKSARYEGGATSIYEISGTTARSVLSAGCAE